MKLIIIRHGETVENKENIVQGHIHGTLSAEGKEQAKKLAKRLSFEKIDVIYSSDLGRALQTAREIAVYHKNVLLIETKLLRERDHGSNTGKRRQGDLTKRSEDAETDESLRERAIKIFNEAYEKYPNGTVVFVTHGGLKMSLVGYLTGRTMHEVEKPKNSSVTVFEINGEGKHKLILWNCTKHLEQKTSQ